jgi:hypothetical protein
MITNDEPGAASPPNTLAEPRNPVVQFSAAGVSASAAVADGNIQRAAQNDELARLGEAKAAAENQRDEARRELAALQARYNELLARPMNDELIASLRNELASQAETILQQKATIERGTRNLQLLEGYCQTRGIPQSQVVKPISHDEATGTSNEITDLETKMAETTDPKQKYKLAEKLAALRNPHLKKDL